MIKQFYTRFLLLNMLLISMVSLCAAQTAVRVGPYVGLQYGYLYTSFGTTLDMYAQGSQSVAPEGTYFLFRPEVGYNFTSLLGVEIGGLQFTDEAQSSSTDPVQAANIAITSVDALALIHLPLDKSGDWVGTPKVGFSLMSASLHYKFYSGTGNGSPWDGGTNINQTSKKTILVPSVGLEFEHSYNRHWIMTFSYQYYYAKVYKFNDPYFSPVSTLGFFSTGVIYKF